METDRGNQGREASHELHRAQRHVGGPVGQRPLEAKHEPSVALAGEPFHRKRWAGMYRVNRSSPPPIVLVDMPARFQRETPTRAAREDRIVLAEPEADTTGSWLLQNVRHARGRLQQLTVGEPNLQAQLGVRCRPLTGADEDSPLWRYFIACSPTKALSVQLSRG